MRYILGLGSVFVVACMFVGVPERTLIAGEIRGLVYYDEGTGKSPKIELINAINASGGKIQSDRVNPDSWGFGTGDMQGSNNLSELTDTAAARGNLGVADFVAGPGASTDSEIAVFDGVTGKVLKQSGEHLSSYVKGPSETVEGAIAFHTGTDGKVLNTTTSSNPPRIDSSNGALTVPYISSQGLGPDSYNEWFGKKTGENVTEGKFNTAAGSNAAASLTEGSSVTAIGYAAGESMTTASNNTLVGAKTGESIVDAESCTAIGVNALGANVSGDINTAVGASALQRAEGTLNIGLGSYAGQHWTGSQRLYISPFNYTDENEEFSESLIVGEFSTDTNTQWLRINGTILINNDDHYLSYVSEDTGFGSLEALVFSSTAGAAAALCTNIQGTGKAALVLSDTDIVGYGTDGITGVTADSFAISGFADGVVVEDSFRAYGDIIEGNQKLADKYQLRDFSNATGNLAAVNLPTGGEWELSYPIAITGDLASFSGLDSSRENEAIGANAGGGGDLGYYNTIYGARAMRYSDNTTSYNTAVGYRAMEKMLGTDNVATGAWAGLRNEYGSGNTLVGAGAMMHATSGDSNACFGEYAGYYRGTGADTMGSFTDCVYVGAFARGGGDAVANEVVIGAGAVGGGSNTVTIGNAAATKTIIAGSACVGTSTASNKLTVVSTDRPQVKIAYDSNGSGLFLNCGSATGGGYYNWQISQNMATTNSLEFTPSLAGDGTTFASVPVLTLTSDSRAGFGTKTPSERVHVHGESATTRIKISTGATTYSSTLNFQNGANDESIIYQHSTNEDLRFRTKGSDRVIISSAGAVTVANLSGSGNRAVYSDPNGVLTNTSSDARLKVDVRDLTESFDPIQALDSLRGVTYNWKDAERLGNQREIGMIAQEVEAVMPELIGTNADGTKSLDYPKMVAYLVEVSKAQQKHINRLEDRINKLEMEAGQ